MNLTASLVIYNNDPEDIKKVIDSVVNSVSNCVFNAIDGRRSIEENVDKNIENIVFNNAVHADFSNVDVNINANANMDERVNVKHDASQNINDQNKHPQALNVILYIIDNSPDDKLKQICCGENVHYIFNGLNNRGFGAGHNIGIKMAEACGSDFHFVINPDVFFDSCTLSKIVDFMQNNQHIGLLMPKILFPNAEVQYVCKLMPTPLNLLIRGFGLDKKWKWAKKIDDDYEMKFSDYNSTMQVPCVSGCFMVFNTKVFSEVGYFDENIFMYFEDMDISRRVLEKYDVVMYSDAIVYHKWNRAVYNASDAVKFKKIIFKSAWYYFNKWGWICDTRRKKINTRIKHKHK